MRFLHSISLLAAAVLSLTFLSSCNENLEPDDNTPNNKIIRVMNRMNKDISIDGDIEFMILTPSGLTGVAYKNFIMSSIESGEYDDLNGKSFFAVTSAGKYANDIVTIMGYSQNLSKSLPGDKLNLERVTSGNMLSSNSNIAFARYEGGDIYVKSISDTSIILRFVKVRVNNALGDYIFNGDLTFDIE